MSQCSLSHEQLQTQRAELLPGFFAKAELMEDIPDGIRVHLKNYSGLDTEISSIISRENVCCSFLKFKILHGGPASNRVLEITGPPGTSKMLRSL